MSTSSMQQQQLSRLQPMPEPAADEVANAHVQASEDLSKDCDTELFLLGAAELEMGNLPGAAELLAQAIVINPNVAVYHAQLGRACALLRRFDDAVTAFGRAVALDPHPAEHHYQLGLALGRSGDATSAIVALERAVTLNPAHAAAYHHLGRNLQECGDLSSAIANYERAVFFDSGLADAHNDLGRAFVQMGAGNAAASCFRRAIELAPGLPEAHYNLGRLLVERGEVLASVDEFRKLVALEPAPGNWAELGNALALYGDDESAEICHRLARDRAGVKRLGAELYRDFLALPPTDEVTFTRGVRKLLGRAWMERCRVD